MKLYEPVGNDACAWMEPSDKGQWVDADIAQELYETIADIASLYKSDIVPSDDYCWDEVVEMCRKAKKKADKD